MKRWVAATVVVVALLLVVGITCRRDRTDATTTTTTPDASTSTPAQGSRAHVREESTPAASDEHTAEDERSTFARVTAGRSEHDLRLLADVQKQLQGPAPASVDRLLAMRDEGASREDLTRQIDEEVEGVLVQAACRRWLALELGDAQQPSKIGEGGRKSSVKPVQRRQQ